MKKQLDEMRIEGKINEINFEVEKNNEFEIQLLLQEVIEEDSPRLYRKVLTRCNLPEKFEIEIKKLLRGKVGSSEGDLENFLYEYIKNPNYINGIIPGGAQAIKIFLIESFEKQGVIVPEDIFKKLDEIIEVEKNIELNMTMEVLRQHVFRDDKSNNPPVRFDYSKYIK